MGGSTGYFPWEDGFGADESQEKVPQVVGLGAGGANGATLAQAKTGWAWVISGMTIGLALIALLLFIRYRKTIVDALCAVFSCFLAGLACKCFFKYECCRKMCPKRRRFKKGRKMSSRFWSPGKAKAKKPDPKMGESGLPKSTPSTSAASKNIPKNSRSQETETISLAPTQPFCSNDLATIAFGPDFPLESGGNGLLNQNYGQGSVNFGKSMTVPVTVHMENEMSKEEVKIPSNRGSNAGSLHTVVSDEEEGVHEDTADLGDDAVLDQEAAQGFLVDVLTSVARGGLEVWKYQ